MSGHAPLRQEVLGKGPDGSPAFGYRVAKNAIASFERKVRDLTAGKCLFASKEDGDYVKVMVFGFSDEPNIVDGLTALANDVDISADLLQHADFDPANMAFKQQNRRPRR